MVEYLLHHLLLHHCIIWRNIYCIIGASVGIASGIFSFVFSITTRSVKKLLKTARNKNKKYNTIALINNEISHEDFKTNINGEKNIVN